MTTKPAHLDAFDHTALLVLEAVSAVIAWAVLFPMVSAPIALALAAGLFLGWPFGVIVAGVSVVGMLVWRQKSPRTFQRWVTARARTRFLAWTRYTRRWAPILGACHLTTETIDGTAIPHLIGVQIGITSDRVRARMLPGQSPDDWEARTVHLAHAFGALDCRATIIGPAVLELVFRHQDSLADPVTLPGPERGPWGKEAA